MSTTAVSPAAPIDTGPLSWVMAEIREALKRSKTALFEAGGRAREERATALQHAKSHLHQAHGALLMVDLDGVCLLTQAAEQALDRFQDGTLEYNVGQASVVAELYQALVEYLEELLAGAPSQPLRLFPYYRALLEMQGAARIHPADLFFPEPAPLPAALAAVPAAPADYPACRQRFEKALLPFLKSGDEAARLASAAVLHEAVRQVAQAQPAGPARAFWLAQQGFAELVAAGRLASGLYVKQLFGLINLQMRRLTQGDAGLPEGMLREALFFIAGTAPADGSLAQQLRGACRFDGLVPSDYEARRYCRIDPEALERARQALARAKAAWADLAAAESGPDAVPDAAFGAALAQVAALAERLKVPALGGLMRRLDSVAALSAKTGYSPELELEMAAALLYAEHGLEQIRRLPDDFAGGAATISARLAALVAGTTPPSQWQGDLARQIEQDQTVAALAAEMTGALRQVEKLLDEYDADRATRPALAAVAPLLHQLQGALAVLDQEPAMAAAQQVAQAVQQLARGGLDAAAEARALDQIAQNVGALGFFVDMLGRNVAAARARFRFDPAAGTFRAIPFEKIAAAEPVPVLERALELAPAAPAAAPPAGAADVEAELLDIFIAEAQEVLAFIGAALARARSGSAEELALLRRSFHTLKGSARMVGLQRFSEAAGAVERVMNGWLADQRAPSDALFDLIEQAHGDLRAWVLALAGGQPGSCDVAALLSAAERVGLGQPFELRAAPESAAAAPRDDSLKQVGTLEISMALYNIYLAETDELLRVLTRDFGEWRHELQRAASAQALAATHTLAGCSGTVGFKALRALARALEAALEAAVPDGPGLSAPQCDLLDATVACIGQMLQAFALGELAPEPSELIAALEQLREQLTVAAPAAAAAPDDVEARLEQLFADAYDSIVAGAEPAAHAPAGQEPAAAASGLALQPAPALAPEPESAPALPAPADRREAIVAGPEQDAARLDALFTEAYAGIIAAVAQVVPKPEPEAPPTPEPEGPAEAEPPVEPQAAPSEQASDLSEQLLVSAGAALSDELDPDLLPVFLEEGADLLPQVGQALRAWRRDPHDAAQAHTLLRVLHTLKGSARMAGAMRLGQHAHEIETHIENMLHAGSATPQAFDELLAHYDHALMLFEQLQQPAPEPAAAGAAAAQPAGPAAPAPAAPAPAERAPLVRVRADILDRLVSQAGEVSIARSKLENEVGGLRASLVDLSDNLARLRRQLREVEVQAESQIASRMAVSSEREFDPLEFDRFTRLQELTRMMAESVNDIASFHENLARTADSASDDLALQARLTRDLQRDLMRVRMVPFGSIAERLFRVARQSAKQVDKRVNVDLRGGAVEIDRSVLERMAAPFEHLLRNAIAHGIEAGPERLAAGKAETGELLVQVSQQGNEVVIEFSDDGAGLDLARIRAKARSCGLLGADEQVDDAHAADLIFEPGFSTADALTELAGRGVGMDVVRSEAQALGGRVELVSQAGKGVCFTIRLPLTLALTQVVLITCAGKRYALPATLIEQVRQMKQAELAEAYAHGALPVQDQPVPLQYLSCLLGEAAERPQAARSYPVLILKNGSDRLALQVDEVLGNREVVIKNIGPQLARMAGIAGATVLGSGEIVLILNPVALARHLELHPELRPQYAAATGRSVAAPPQQVIMVVDDSLTVRRVTQRLLEREGYRVLLAKDGVDALEQLQDARPSLMLVDIEMPRMDGFDLTRNVRGDARTQAIPIIMITSRSADKHRNYALELGVNAFFGKPFQEPVLLAAIAGLLEQEAPAPV